MSSYESLWAHLTYAHAVATAQARRTGRRQIVRPQRVANDLLWRVVPVSALDTTRRYAVPSPLWAGGTR